MQKIYAGKIGLICIIALMFVVQPAFAKSRKDLAKSIRQANSFFKEVMEDRDTRIPKSILKKSNGIIILHQYKVGLVFGVKGGGGIVLAKDEATQKWSPPAFIKTIEGSYGIQVGGQSVDSIFLIMDTNTLKKLIAGKFKIGVDASAAIGTMGSDVEAKVGHGVSILAYSRAKGLFAGAAFEGGVLTPNNDNSEYFYGIKGIKARDILFRNKARMPKSAKPLIRLLEQYTDSAK